ncbi:MAG: thiolase family protein [Acidobacteriota bacterium]
MLPKKIAIIDGLRTPFIKSWTLFSEIHPVELGRIVVQELIWRNNLSPSLISEVIFGNIAQPVDSINISRVIALKAGIPVDVPAYTVGRNCASGLEAITSAAEKISLGLADVVIGGGVESMSSIPFLYRKKAVDFFQNLQKAKKFRQRLKGFLKMPLGAFLNPVVGVMEGLRDNVSGMMMGDTAELLAREYKISRLEQDKFSLMSHQRAEKATADGKLKEEIVPVFIPPDYKTPVDEDNGIRKGQTLEALSNLKPFFDRRYGTVTAGNSSQITDGAAAMILMSEERAKELGYEPMGIIRSYAYAGVEPERMGLGPAMATPLALKRGGASFKDIQLIEINEAFAAVVIANEIAFKSKEFASKYYGDSNPLGEINREILNVNGGAIALGHPVATSGARLVITILKEMKRRNLNLGLVALCVGGGQGGSLLLEIK